MPDSGDSNRPTPQCRGLSESVDLRIEALTAGGRGLARPGGPVWFVPGVFPGDRILAVAEKRRERYVEGKAVALQAATPDRRPPPCPIQGSCGGCAWMPLQEGAQREWKERLVREALERIGGFPAGAVEAIRAGDRALGYRNRIELSLGRDQAGLPTVGMYAADPARGLVDVERCLLQTDAAGRVLVSAREFLLAPGRRWPAVRPREPFRLAVRSSAAGERVIVALWESGAAFPEAEELAAWLRERHPELQGVARVRTASRRRGGARAAPLVGTAWLEERIGGIDFRIPVTAFTQVNVEWSTRLPELVREIAGDVAGADVVDLYGGIGVNAFELVRAGAASALVCEADVEATKCGRSAARHAGLEKIRFLHCDAAEFVERRWPTRRSVDVVVANPPRSGMGPRVVRALANHAAPRIVLVSCDPPTLARDARILGEHGYGLRRAIPLDLFPQTPHVETVALLTRTTPQGAASGSGTI